MANGEREEKKYYQKLGIVPTSIDNIKKIIKTNIKNTIKCWNEGRNIEKQTFRVVSPAGIGKTQTALQICDELTEELGFEFKHILIKAPVLSRDDFLCPFPVIDNGNSKFKMLYSDFVPLEENTYGLFIIDELSRGDSSLQQLLWSVQNESKIHTKKLPQGWFVLCLDNPDDQEYSLNVLEDVAGLRRVLHLYSEVNVKAFLDHAVKANFHPSVIEFIETYPQYLYDFNSQKIGRIYANPASYERVSNILWGYDKDDGILKNLNDLTILFEGLLNQTMSRIFINFLKDLKQIRPKDIFYDYEKIRNIILDYCNKSNNIKLGQILESFVTFLTSTKPQYTEKELQNITTFLTDIPPDIGATFLLKIDNFDKNSMEFKYFTEINITLLTNSQEYKMKFFDTMRNLSKKAFQNG